MYERLTGQLDEVNAANQSVLNARQGLAGRAFTGSRPDAVSRALADALVALSKAQDKVRKLGQAVIDSHSGE